MLKEQPRLEPGIVNPCASERDGSVAQ